MSEQQSQGQNASDAPPKNNSDEGKQQREQYVPRDRFDDVNGKKAEAEKRAREAEARLQEIEGEREQQQEERAQKQGEYQQLAEKRKTDLDKEKVAHAETKKAWQRERRRNTWNSAAQGIIKSNAIADSFTFLSEDELSNLDEGDTEGYKQLAQNLVEVRDYLAAEGTLGAGSGGSSRPVLGHAGSPDGTRREQVTNRQPILKKSRRRPWK